MLHTLTNKTDDEAFYCWSNVVGEEARNDEAELANVQVPSKLGDRISFNFKPFPQCYCRMLLLYASCTYHWQ